MGQKNARMLAICSFAAMQSSRVYLSASLRYRDKRKWGNFMPPPPPAPRWLIKNSIKVILYVDRLKTTARKHTESNT